MEGGVILQNSQVQRLGLPANTRCGAWADGRVLARCSCDAGDGVSEGSLVMV